MPSSVSILRNDTVSANGQAVRSATSSAVLVINLTQDAPGGSTVAFIFEEVDPGDETTVIGVSVTTGTLSTAGVKILTLRNIAAFLTRISWVFTGTTPIDGVYATMVDRSVIDQTLTDEITGTTISKALYDFSVSNTIFIGYSVRGTATSAAAWRIKKVILDNGGNPTDTLWTGTTAIWDNRTTETYS